MKVEHGVKAVVSREVTFVGVIVDASLFTLCCHFALLSFLVGNLVCFSGPDPSTPIPLSIPPSLYISLGFVLPPPSRIHSPLRPLYPKVPRHPGPTPPLPGFIPFPLISDPLLGGQVMVSLGLFSPSSSSFQLSQSSVILEQSCAP